ncbi:DHH phosphoesterase [Dothidotthia symphoricarpi CBS 119687]|uniref:DHH phosphoesterase n=1 Tax=Dothidotthia symphoricarpi CBS 119687 TaxID=1392245 RepID=A0A6A6AKZ7_9PLEO|nr:DHH phosphoesterase [Dothidotthia symphoricarpi CBS 119687]KAF2132639.1 DHH phosphoesterase [Dothidotthia symphoricarpi CBS 119687]
MKAFLMLLPGLLATAMPQRAPVQAILGASHKKPDKHVGVGHFSEWSRATKKEFLLDWQAGKVSEWTLVQGNEGGDMDSMTAALTWAYHLKHATANTSHPIKAIALLQTPTHALDLRPENKLALANSQMTPGHEDLLTIDELPEDPDTLSKKIKGIVLVDHGVPLRKWREAKILSIFDHHKDENTAPDAKPRIIEKTASCTTIVARQMLDELENLDQEYHMPHELLELILSAIAIDSGGLTSDKTTPTDTLTSKRVLKRSAWAKKHLDDVMEDLDDQLSTAQKDIDELELRDLLRRDWKGDLIDTPSPRTPTVSLGFASVPYSMDDQITKTDFAELFDWFAVHAAWTAEAGVDISICLNKYKKRDKKGKKQKIREIVLTVRDDVRVDQDQADALFEVVKHALENNKEGIKLTPWHRANELSARQMVWTHQSDAGRKIIRPIVEEAVVNWD